jgi:F-box and WD-40 domain protein CDC4
VVSGSYDTTARVWSISEGRCLKQLSGHFSQIYAIAFDGKRVATGSLDTSVRIWNPHDGYVPPMEVEDDLLTCDTEPV